jgi:hypothetical protein
MDETFGTSGITTTDFFGNADEALGLALYNDKIILAGKIRNATNYLDYAIARYTNDTEYHLSALEISVTESSTISPNPLKRNSSFELDLYLKQADAISIELLDVNGKSVLLMPSRNIQERNQSIQLQLPANVVPGIYTLRINGSVTQTKSIKLVVAD